MKRAWTRRQVKLWLKKQIRKPMPKPRPCPDLEPEEAERGRASASLPAIDLSGWKWDAPTETWLPDSSKVEEHEPS